MYRSNNVSKHGPKGVKGERDKEGKDDQIQDAF